MEIQPKKSSKPAKVEEKEEGLIPFNVEELGFLKRLLRNLGDSKQEITDTIVGTDFGNIKKGTAVITKSRIISGNYNRLGLAFDVLDRLGVDQSDIRTSVFGNTIAFSPELSPTGLRGEALELARPAPKKEQQPPITQNIMSQANQGERQE
jgi:hypothetical protein